MRWTHLAKQSHKRNLGPELEDRKVCLRDSKKSSDTGQHLKLKCSLDAVSSDNTIVGRGQGVKGISGEVKRIQRGSGVLVFRAPSRNSPE